MVRVRESSQGTGEEADNLKQQIKQLKARLAAYERDKSRNSGLEEISNTASSTNSRRKRRKSRTGLSNVTLGVLSIGVAVGTVKAVMSSGEDGILLDVLDSSIKLLRSWFSLLTVVSREFWKHAKPWAVEGYQRFMALNWVTKLYFLYFGIALTCIWLVHRFVRKRRYVERVWESVESVYQGVCLRYTMVSTAVRNKSLLLAALLPHLLLLGSASTAIYFFPEHVHNVANGLPGFCVKYILPLAFSIRAVVSLPEDEVLVRNAPVEAAEEPTMMSKVYGLIGYASDGEESTKAISGGSRKNPADVLEQVESIGSVLYWLRYWTVLGTLLAVERMPVLGSALTSLQSFKTMKALLAVWLQFPGTAGASLAFAWIIPVVNRYFREVNALNSGKSEGIVSSVLLSFLDAPVKAKVLEVVDTSGTFIFMALPFFFMPFFTDLGCVLFGLVRVIHASLTVALGVENVKKDAETASRRRKKNRFVLHDLSSLGPLCVHWLEYWIIYPPAMYLFNVGLGSVPFSSHAHLLFILWLQIPFFRKSPKHVLDAVVNKVEQWVS